MVPLVIEFLDQSVPNERLAHGERAKFAVIKIGAFTEKLIVPLNYWSAEDYRQQWADACRKITQSTGLVKAALVTEIYDAKETEFATMLWPLYKSGDDVYVRNVYVPANQLKNAKNFDDIYSVVQDRRKSESASEWRVSLSDVKRWLHELEH